MAKTGLLILTSPFSKLKRRIPHVLAAAKTFVRDTLYVHLQPQTSTNIPDPSVSTASQRFSLQPVPLTYEAVHLLQDFYETSSQTLPHLDLRVLQGHFTNGKLKFCNYRFSRNYDIILHDFPQCNNENNCDLMQDISNYFHSHGTVKNVNFERLSLSTMDEKREDRNQGETDATNSQVDVKHHVALGGTFDRLHIGHKMLLSQACFLATDSLTIGISDTPLTARKRLCELIEPLGKRMENVREFLTDVKPGLLLDIFPLLDVYGPTITNPKLDCLVVSQETKNGGNKINIEREKKGMKPMTIHVVDLLEDLNPSINEESKVSSVNQRMRLLGTLLQQPQLSNLQIPSRPYRIGLTGGIASGKSSICNRLQKLGAATINCDKIGHQAYLKGTPVFQELVNTFGKSIVDIDGEINRSALGKIVFTDDNMRKKLNEIVWPAIAKLVELEIQKFAEEGKEIVVLEAAVLLEAKWNSMVHEVWVSIIPKTEAVKRIIERNKLSEVDAEARISSQMSNSERVSAAHVVLCTLWQYEETQRQVEKAWSLLQKRI